jgi:hypothetical protein
VADQLTAKQIDMHHTEDDTIENLFSAKQSFVISIHLPNDFADLTPDHKAEHVKQLALFSRPHL